MTTPTRIFQRGENPLLLPGTLVLRLLLSHLISLGLAAVSAFVGAGHTKGACRTVFQPDRAADSRRRPLSQQVSGDAVGFSTVRFNTLSPCPSSILQGLVEQV